MSGPTRARARDDDDATAMDFGRDGALVGRAAAMADWAFRKEKREDKKLFGRLWARRERMLFPEKVRARKNAWRARNIERARRTDRLYKARRRRPRFIACKRCGTKARATRRKFFCSPTCRTRWNDAHRPSRSKGLRDRSLSGVLLELVRARPGLTLNEICEAAPTLKRGSVATKLTEWLKAGSVRRDGRANGKRGGGRYYPKET